MWEHAHRTSNAALASMMVFWILVFPRSWTRVPGIVAIEPWYKAETWEIAGAGTLTKFAEHTAVRLLHILPAAIWSGSYLLQRSVAARKRWPQVHRLSGRVFFVCSALICAGWVVLEQRGLASEHSGDWAAVSDATAVTLIRTLLYDYPCSTSSPPRPCTALLGPCVAAGEPAPWTLRLASSMLLLAPLAVLLTCESVIGWRRALGCREHAAKPFRPWGAALLFAASYAPIVALSEQAAVMTASKGLVMVWFALTACVSFGSIAFARCRDARRHERWAHRHFAAGIWVSLLRVGVGLVPYVSRALGAVPPGLSAAQAEAQAPTNAQLVMLQKSFWNNTGTLGWMATCFVTEGAIWAKRAAAAEKKRRRIA